MSGNLLNWLSAPKTKINLQSKYDHGGKGGLFRQDRVSVMYSRIGLLAPANFFEVRLPIILIVTMAEIIAIRVHNLSE